MEKACKSAQFTFRTDYRLFFDTSKERKREDIPSLNQLADILQNFLGQLSYALERSPLRLRCTGRCRPMLAYYKEGGYYIPHIDGNGDGRVLTAVYYLNRQWPEEGGGDLRLYPQIERRQLQDRVDSDEPHITIAPLEDSLAIFQADWMVHEVAF